MSYIDVFHNNDNLPSSLDSWNYSIILRMNHRCRGKNSFIAWEIFQLLLLEDTERFRHKNTEYFHKIFTIKTSSVCTFIVHLTKLSFVSKSQITRKKSHTQNNNSNNNNNVEERLPYNIIYRYARMCILNVTCLLLVLLFFCLSIRFSLFIWNKTLKCRKHIHWT